MIKNFQVIKPDKFKCIQNFIKNKLSYHLDKQVILVKRNTIPRKPQSLLMSYLKTDV